MKQSYTLLIATLLALAAPSFTTLMECPEGIASIGEVEALYSPDFPDLNEEVQLVVGAHYTFGIKFYAGSDSPTLVPKLLAFINGIPAPWTGAGNDACKNMTESTSCPLVKDEWYHYLANIQVPSAGMVPFVFQWSLEDANKQNQVCFQMDARLVSS